MKKLSSPIFTPIKQPHKHTYSAKHIDIYTDFSWNNGIITGDYHFLYAVFQNLIDNASKYSGNHLTRELTVNGNTTQLKKIDGRFLQLLCAKNHEIAGKAYLIQGVWNKADMKKEPELKKYISHIRTLLKADSTLKIEYQDDGYILMSV